MDRIYLILVGILSILLVMAYVLMPNSFLIFGVILSLILFFLILYLLELNRPRLDNKISMKNNLDDQNFDKSLQLIRHKAEFSPEIFSKNLEIFINKEKSCDGASAILSLIGGTIGADIYFKLKNQSEVYDKLKNQSKISKKDANLILNRFLKDYTEPNPSLDGDFLNYKITLQDTKVEQLVGIKLGQLIEVLKDQNEKIVVAILRCLRLELEEKILSQFNENVRKKIIASMSSKNPINTMALKSLVAVLNKKIAKK